MSEPTLKDLQKTDAIERLTISLKTLAQMLDAHRSSVRRWLQQAGIRPVVLGKSRNGAIRYRWRDVQEWIESRQSAD
ncbi:MAG TPA: helix-turn-helix domain-containing protein [Sedimentisphaerales bacterium]|nr:helix-turn-helix domain-containing protein [Sedimentisphaerales bacterium]